VKSRVLLIHHAANRDHHHPRNSLRALEACLTAGARAVEVDISLLADGRFALLHGPLLQPETTGSGAVSAHTTDQARGLHYVSQGDVTDVPLSFLSEITGLLRRHPDPIELQLDLKADVFHPNAVLAQLAADLQPVKHQVRVTSPADWALRGLRAIDSDLALGFDPQLHLTPDSGEARDAMVPPFRLGDSGYWDDHPLANQRWKEPAAYLAARAETLWVQAPAGVTWHISARLLERALDDGFDWIAYLHARGVRVGAWTLDAQHPEQVALARRMAAQGVDSITTNDAPILAEALDLAAVY